MRSQLRFFLILSLLALTVACARPSDTPKTDDPEQSPIETLLIFPSDLTQPPQIAIRIGKDAAQQASNAIATAFLRIEGQELVLRRDHLDQSLVFFVAIAAKSQRDSAPELLTHDAPLVHFSRVGNQLHLVEEPIARMAHAHNNVPVMLASFPITSSTKEDIRFDFHAGALNDLYATRHLSGAADVNAMTIMGGPPTIRPSNAYFRAMSSGDGWVSLEQVVSNTSSSSGGVVRFTFWRTDASALTPLADDPNDHLGYFNTTVHTVGETTPKQIVRRWDPTRPVTFYISSNTPSIYRPAIREGVLAWNRVLGREWLQVAEAAFDITPGDPRYPLIYWVEGPRASAVGMTQSHPLTGETLTGLVTIFGGWATVAQKTVTLSESETSPEIALNGFSPAPLCQYDGTPWAADWLGTASMNALSTVAHRQLGHAQLRAVIMHEIGHVLGLRHNFAGNLSSELSAKAQATALQQLMDGAPDMDAPLPSSSIMDYLPLVHDVLMHVPGAYDSIALQHAYAPQYPYPSRDETPRFCTDEDVATIADCQRHDGGRDPLVWSLQEIEAGIEAYNRWLLSNIVIAPAEMATFIPDEGLRDFILRRIRTGVAVLSGYEDNNTWILDGAYPYERAAKARRALIHLQQSPFPGRHPTVRGALAATMEQLERNVAAGGEAGRWAGQILRNLAAALARTNIPK